MLLCHSEKKSSCK